MGVFSYRTVESRTEGLYKEKGSKFISFVIPVTSEAEAKAELDQVRKKYFDASHHCFAFVLGADKSKSRAFDDGEPNHSAGDPILGQIKSRDLTNILVIVVRYFGGTKLGVGGLIQAYRNSAEDALSKCMVVERPVTRLFQLLYDLSSTPEVMKLVKEFEVQIVEQNFGDRAELKADVKLQNSEAVVEKLKLLKALGNNIEFSILT